jgi:hypothetical protein
MIVMNDFQRVLISYPHGNPREKSTAWSNFSWCYIKHDITGIKIYTASANNSETAAMPEITEFQELCTGHSSEIIRVIDLSESTPVYYCLTINQKCLYKLTFTRSDFASGPPFLQDLALQWNPQDSSDPWKSAQHKMSKDIRRLDHHTPLTKINLENFQNQYNQWLATINAVQQAAQNAIVAQTNWLMV